MNESCALHKESSSFMIFCHVLPSENGLGSFFLKLRVFKKKAKCIRF
jgi:hypothetical protein